MIKNCPFCNNELKICHCMKRQLRSNMIDSSIFLGAYDEGKHSDKCRLLLEGAKKNIYLGHVSTIVLGEITKKLLRLKKEAKYRYDAIYDDIMNYLTNFVTLYICEDTIKIHSSLDIRGKEKSQDKINFSCALANNCSLFIIQDESFSCGKKTKTKIIQISDTQSPILRRLLDEIKRAQSLNS